ncbi:hypothetical protein BDN67DRAFT_1072998 [Paxillus ammoniavirescens]|nr:hypothetical protein BDN67DRAFT_1072998 [Paxillus ammoniavirescens]
MTTPQANQPSIHSDLETEPTRTHTERTEIITHEIDRLLHHIHELVHFRGQETHEISENVRIIRDELIDLSEYVRTRLVATERVVVAEQPGAPPVALPIALTPPPMRSPSISSSRSVSSFLSSHHSDDLSLLGAEEEFNMPPPSPGWPSEPSLPSSDVTPSIISSSESSPEPSLSLTSSSSSPPPPSSPTPSTDSSSTARPMTGLWDGQVSTNHILDKLRQARDAPRDDVEIHELLRHIENLIETLIQRRQETTGEIGETRDESVTESDATLDILDALHRGWSG